MANEARVKELWTKAKICHSAKLNIGTEQYFFYIFLNCMNTFSNLCTKKSKGLTWWIRFFCFMWYSVRFHKVLPNTWKVATHVAHAVPSSFLMTQFWRHNSCSPKAEPGYFFRIQEANFFLKKTKSQSTILTWSYKKLNQFSIFWQFEN